MPTSGQTHEFIIYAMRERARAENLTTCYCKKQIESVCHEHDLFFNDHEIAVDPRGDTLLTTGQTQKLPSICHLQTGVI